LTRLSASNVVPVWRNVSLMQYLSINE